MGTETPGKQPSKQLSRQESQQELNSYFAKSNTTELVKMTSTATSERSGRIPDLKTTTSVSSSTSSAASTRTQESSLLVSKHPLLCSLLSSPSPSSWWSHPEGSRARRSAWEEAGGVRSRDQTSIQLLFIYSWEHYGIMEGLFGNKAF